MILIYDSGLGGISALNAIVRRYPQRYFVFFGDRKHAPYGNKEKHELISIFENNIERFQRMGVTDIIMQCNTMCSTLDLNKYPFKIHDIISETLKPFKHLDRHKQVLVCATKATINGGRYQKQLKEMGYKNVKAIALRELAGMIERYASESEIEAYLRSELHDERFDYVILACTHYPFYDYLFKKLTTAEIYDSRSLSYDFIGEVDKGKRGLYLDLEKDDKLLQFLDAHLEVEYQWYEKD